VPRTGAATASALVPSAGAPCPPPDAAAQRALLLGQAPWRARRSLRSGNVPKYASLADAASGALRRGEPAVLAGLRLSQLRLAAGGGGGGSRAAAAGAGAPSPPTPGVTVYTSAPNVNRFFEVDAAKNADPSAYYHVAYPGTSSTAAAAAAAAAGAPAAAAAAAGSPPPPSASLGEWLRRAPSWSETRTLCRALLGAWDATEGPAAIAFRPNAPALREASRALSAAPPRAEPAARPPPPPLLDPSDLLDWSRVLELLRAVAARPGGGVGGPLPAGELWLEACNPRAPTATATATAALLLPMRALPFARAIVQVSGHRRVVLVDPALTYGEDEKGGGLRPFPFAHPLEGYSGRRWEEGDEVEENEEEVAAARAGEQNVPPRPVRGRVAELAPGDALIIPAHWWAHQELLPSAGAPPSAGAAPPPLNAALELRLLPPAGAAAAAAVVPMSAGALRAHAARLAEGVLAASLGAPAVARCLEALACSGGGGDAAAAAAPPPPTVRAYDRAVACGEAFEMLVAACLAAPSSPPAKGPVGRLRRAEAEARALCAAMAAGGRLRGGAGAAEVGSRAGLEAQRWLIEEDAEAARFPTLFRHRLLGARDDWREHAVPLLPAAVPERASAGALAAAAAAERPAPSPPTLASSP